MALLTAHLLADPAAATRPDPAAIALPRRTQGIMALPKAFATMGLLLGGVVLVVAYLLSSFSLQELVHVSQVGEQCAP